MTTKQRKQREEKGWDDHWKARVETHLDGLEQEPNLGKVVFLQREFEEDNPGNEENHRRNFSNWIKKHKL